MSKMIGKAFMIQTLTNLHMGDMGGGVSIVDLPVQRDSTNHFPTIHSSGLKGSLRDALSHNSQTAAAVPAIFGSDGGTVNGETESKDGDNEAQKAKKTTQKGSFCFLPSLLFAYPMRGNTSPWCPVVCPETITSCMDLLLATCAASEEEGQAIRNTFEKLLPGEKSTPVHAAHSQAYANRPQAPQTECFEGISLPGLEGIESAQNRLLPPHCPPLRRMKDEDFGDIMHNSLPVIARNKLDNGISRHLWYEEVVPRQTFFLCVILCPCDDGTDQKNTELLVGALDNKVHQIGAGATIGYGYVRFRALNFLPQGGSK